LNNSSSHKHVQGPSTATYIVLNIYMVCGRRRKFLALKNKFEGYTHSKCNITPCRYG
jgi:hypothetical protein